MTAQILNEVKAVRSLMKRLNKINNDLTHHCECKTIENFVVKETTSHASIIEPLIITMCIAYPDIAKKTILHLVNKYCPNNTHTLLIQYLTENNILENYKTNITQFQAPYYTITNPTVEGIVTSLYAYNYFKVFLWQDTAEGYDFWIQHYLNWMGILKSLSRNSIETYGAWMETKQHDL